MSVVAVVRARYRVTLCLFNLSQVKYMNRNQPRRHDGKYAGFSLSLLLVRYLHLFRERGDSYRFTPQSIAAQQCFCGNATVVNSALNADSCYTKDRKIRRPTRSFPDTESRQGGSLSFFSPSLGDTFSSNEDASRRTRARDFVQRLYFPSRREISA